MGGHGSSVNPTVESKSGFQSGTNEPKRILPLGELSTHACQPLLSEPALPQADPIRSGGEFIACCLLGKIWGEVISLNSIIHRTRNDWKFMKGHVDYDNWLLLRFSTSQDKNLVFEQRPWFVNGLNFVLLPWTPFFDPYNTIITRVDQWIRILRLPWELWELDYLTEVLKHVGQVIRLDNNSLLRLKGKFACICVNLDIIKPLPGSLIVSDMGSCLRVTIIYEGLHEVCPLCEGESHQLESCPKLPEPKKIEVFCGKV